MTWPSVSRTMVRKVDRSVVLPRPAMGCGVTCTCFLQHAPRRLRYAPNSHVRAGPTHDGRLPCLSLPPPVIVESAGNGASGCYLTRGARSWHSGR